MARQWWKKAGASRYGAVRKRGADTRARSRHRRPKTPAPREGWLLKELSALTNIRVRTLRNYIAAGIIRPIEFRGTATRYARRDLLRLLRMLRMYTTAHKLRLSEVKQKLDALGDAELEAWVVTQPLAPHVSSALGIVAKSAATTAATVQGASAVRGVTGETWQRFRLLPGLELSVSSEASVAVRGIAQRICDEYLARASPSAERATP